MFQFRSFGVGARIGTGIFIVLTEAVPVGGPAVILSFVFAAAVAGLTAICYAELASTVPVAGSSYSYAYATLFGFTMPDSLSEAPEQGGVVNLPAVILIFVVHVAAAASGSSGTCGP